MNHKNYRLILSGGLLVAVLSVGGCGGGGGGGSSSSGGGGGGGVPTPSNLYVTNGTVNATALSADGNTLYLGGSFTQMGPRSGAGVPINSTSALPVSGYSRVGGQVFASVPDGSGGWYIGGNFTVVGGLARNNIARILANGSVDPAWNPGADSIVNALAVSGTTVYAGGSFTAINNDAGGYIAAIAR